MMRDREIVEAELILLRHDRVVLAEVNRGERARNSPGTRALVSLAELKGAEAALLWALNGVPARGPMSGIVRDPEDQQDRYREWAFAEDLHPYRYDEDRGPEISREAAGMNVRAYALAVAITLDWLRSDDAEMSTARGSSEQDILDSLDDLLEELPQARALYGFRPSPDAGSGDARRPAGALGRVIGP